jgi:hypothetical protein
VGVSGCSVSTKGVLGAGDILSMMGALSFERGGLEEEVVVVVMVVVVVVSLFVEVFRLASYLLESNSSLLLYSSTYVCIPPRKEIHS